MAAELAAGAGRVIIDPTDGSPVQVVDPDAPDRRFVLDERTDPSHSAEHRWGSGFVITDTGSARWRDPDDLLITPGRVEARFDLGPGLRLTVHRTAGDRMVERYELHNLGSTTVRVGSLAINVPLRDVYAGAAEALREAVHAHVWTGGADAWVLAEPMSGTGQSLGLILDVGELWSYSIEGRNTTSGSNVRGHLLLHATDRTRNPTAFGGQPEIVIEPGSCWVLQWRIGLYPDRDAFLADTAPGLVCDRLTAPVGEPITVTGDVVGLAADHGAVVQTRAGTGAVIGTRHGVVHVGTGSRRTAVLFTEPLPDLVRRRVRFILDHQRATERPAPYDAAFVPYDTRTGLTQTANGWPDWSDGAERLSMPTLLQQALARGWVDDPVEVADALTRFGEFARTGLLDHTAAPSWGSTVTTPVRIYNSPWLAHFFADEFVRTDDPAHLDLAARILDRSFELGAGEHLSIGHPEAVVAVADLLAAGGAHDRADRLTRLLTDQAEHFRALADDLPRHEVHYEQSMVAPLVTLYATVAVLQADDRLLAQLETTVRWLRAFGGPQPHVRLHQIAIRHWDGYWFGRERQWGDTFPHYWSVLTAVALRQLPAALRTEESDATAEQIFRANLVGFRADGSATCAFVLPSTVDGRPGYRDDPLANDQDWALTLWLRHGA